MTHEIPKNGARVVEQAVAVLRALSSDKGQKGVRELARDLQFSATTVQRILVSLERTGLVVYDPATQKYSLGVGVLEFTSSFLRNNSVVSIARPHMQYIWQLAQETVCLSTIVDSARITIFQLECPHDLRFTTDLGKRYPLYAGATSRALLASLSYETAKNMIYTINFVKLTPNTIETPDQLLQEIMKVRERGYAVSFSEYAEGGAGLAVPIGRNNQRPLALSIYAPASRMTRERVNELLPVMREAADRLAQDLKYWLHAEHSDMSVRLTDNSLGR